MAMKQSITFVILVLGTFVAVTGVLAQVNQRAVARQILSGDLDQRSKALETIRALGPAKIDPELRDALIRALEQENATVRTRRSALQRGELLEPVKSDFYGRVAEVIVELHDPKAINSLAGALGTGLMVVRALAEFGERAVQPAVLVVTSQHSLPNEVADGLMTLRLMVEGRPNRQLSARSLAEMRRAAEQRLTGKQYPTTLWHAIDLAIALEDPDLMRVVSALAVDSEAVTARGMTDPDLIQRTQERARDRLAGFPPIPRP